MAMGCWGECWEECPPIQISASSSRYPPAKWPLPRLPRLHPTCSLDKAPWSLSPKSVWVFALFVPRVITLYWIEQQWRWRQGRRIITHQMNDSLLWWEWYNSAAEQGMASTRELPAWVAASNGTPRSSRPGSTPPPSYIKKGLENDRSVSYWHIQWLDQMESLFFLWNTRRAHVCAQKRDVCKCMHTHAHFLSTQRYKARIVMMGGGVILLSSVVFTLVICK